MALFTLKTSKKVDTHMRLEESTAVMLDRYAHFQKGTADEVVNGALEYVFKHDKDFQRHIQQNPDEQVASSVRVKKAPGSAKATAKSSASTGTSSSRNSAVTASLSSNPK